MPQSPTALCPILGRTTEVESTGYSRGPWQVVRCRETGLVFLANPPEYGRLETEFAWEKTKSQERTRRAHEEPVISRFSSAGKWLKAKVARRRCKMFALAREVIREQSPSHSVHVLDVGCGGGGLMETLHHRFAQFGRRIIPYGIEVSQQLAAKANARLQQFGGRAVQACALEGAKHFAPGGLDVIVMHSFLEHEQQPLALLETLRPCLRDGGAVVLKVPNFNCLNRHIRGRKWCGFRYPDHVLYFTPRTLSVLAEQAGFKVVRQKWIDKSPLSDNMYAVLRPFAMCVTKTTKRHAA